MREPEQQSEPASVTSETLPVRPPGVSGGTGPGRLPERVELSLGGRQVFFLFFGCAALACALFASGVLVGKRIAQQAASSSAIEDPLAALDRLEAEQIDDGLDFHEALARPEPRRAHPAPKPAAAPKPPESATKPAAPTAAKSDAPTPLPRLPRLPAAPTAKPTH